MTDLRKKLEALVEREACRYADDEYPEDDQQTRGVAYLGHKAGAALLLDAVVDMHEALEKIEDPRKRHVEPDAYTNLCCVMHIASEALSSLEKRIAQSGLAEARASGEGET